jgi:hypothetical protein
MKIVRGLLVFFIFLLPFFVFSQVYDCDFRTPLIQIDFGTITNFKNIDLSFPNNYSKSKNDCPADGQYNFTNYSASCFDGKWHELLQDHTPNDIDGRMIVVNASVKPSTFFKHNIKGLTAGKTYQVSFSIVNICKYADGCSPTPPIIQFSVLNNNAEIVKVNTGAIVQTTSPVWRNFYIDFVMPSTEIITIKMEDITNGGCGNDFAIDDIIFKECRKKEIKIADNLKPAVTIKELPKKKELPLVKVEVKPNVVKEKVTIKTLPAIITNEVEIKKPIVVQPINPKTKSDIAVSIPTILATRENALARKIITEEAEMIIELYDNGSIDGDTVTIYHNNMLIVNHAGLSLKPIVLKIKVDKNAPHHELVMVADNLGSIPPNTSLMIITANKKRFEVYISSTDKKNAKVIIDLEK